MVFFHERLFQLAGIYIGIECGKEFESYLKLSYSVAIYFENHPIIRLKKITNYQDISFQSLFFQVINQKLYTNLLGTGNNAKFS
jgi:hypothetical protein